MDRLTAALGLRPGLTAEPPAVSLTTAPALIASVRAGLTAATPAV